jgi:hypothetical protein
MKSSTVHFTFKKVDGSLREANGTLVGVENMIKGVKNEQFTTIPYFDTDVNDWRSFKAEYLIA